MPDANTILLTLGALAAALITGYATILAAQSSNSGQGGNTSKPSRRSSPLVIFTGICLVLVFLIIAVLPFVTSLKNTSDPMPSATPVLTAISEILPTETSVVISPTPVVGIPVEPPIAVSPTLIDRNPTDTPSPIQPDATDTIPPTANNTSIPLVPTSTKLPSSSPASIGDKVPVADNVTISLTDKQFDWHGTNYQLGRGRTFCSDKTMLWVFRIENASAVGFTPNVDPDNMTMVDSTGKSYKLTEGCYAPFMGPFEGYTTQAGQQDFAGVSFATDSVPATATYFDLTITITGTQLTFRYPLRILSAPLALPTTPADTGDRVPVADNVTISLTDKQFDWHGTNYQLGRGRTFCSDKTMLWVFRIENASAAGFTPNVDPDNMTMVDSTGKSYKLTEGCYAPFMGPFEGYTTQAGQQDFAGVSFATDSVPATATYFDLTITITGTQLTFRYHL